MYRAMKFAPENTQHAITLLNIDVIMIDALMMSRMRLVNLYCATYFVDVNPNPNVENTAMYNNVFFMSPYSPYNSFPKKRAIIMPANNDNPLLATFPNNAQNESRTRPDWSL